MGGPGSGGVRSGTPGKAYANRTDLNASKPLPTTTTTGQTYGTAQAQQQAQRAVPMARPTTPTPQPISPNPGSSLSVPLSAPTTRPNEPVTAGLPSGPGPGPEVLPTRTPDPTSLELRALYRLYPNNDLLSLIEYMDSGQK